MLTFGDKSSCLGEGSHGDDDDDDDNLSCSSAAFKKRTCLSSVITSPGPKSQVSH